MAASTNWMAGAISARLLASDLSAFWHVLGVVIVATGAATWLFWTVRNCQAWKHEFGRRRKRGNLHRIGH